MDRTTSSREPTWEPAGSNWTYLAFVRKEQLQAGVVDLDELLEYMLVEGIVAPDDYLATVEMGIELGTSAGRTLFRKFDVAIE